MEDNLVALKLDEPQHGTPEQRPRHCESLQVQGERCAKYTLVPCKHRPRHGGDGRLRHGMQHGSGESPGTGRPFTPVKAMGNSFGVVTIAPWAFHIKNRKSLMPPVIDRYGPMIDTPKKTASLRGREGIQT